MRGGTFRAALRRYLSGPPPNTELVRWRGTADVREAAAVLIAHGRSFVVQAGGRGVVLTVGDGGDLQRAVDARLRAEGITVRSMTNDTLEGSVDDGTETPVGILCCHTRSAEATHVARVLAARPDLASVRFEYLGGLDVERAQFEKFDEYASTWFVSPVLLDTPNPYAIYEESLEHFEQKCGLRDYLDLYQLIKQVVEERIPGDIAEFGSFRGHSGYLIAQTLIALGSDKTLYMFDTFEQFPDEGLGIDQFWSSTHDVDFDEVRRKLAPFPAVRVIKGDFTDTLGSSGLSSVALAYVDCESYRATRFLLDALLPDRVSVGGLLVCEDYGHPALLGNRAAVHDGLRADHTPVFTFFSQFSGLYIIRKNANRETNA